MTKQRPPLTFENALTTVASLLGWPEVARICGQSERCVRNWSDQDTSAGIKLDAALELDRAYEEAGGDGAPFLLCYSIRLEADLLAARPGRKALSEATALAAKEGGEAIAAAIAAARPGASMTDVALAERELEESISAQTNALAALRAGRRGNVSSPGGDE